jgi:hypothetical protein
MIVVKMTKTSKKKVRTVYLITCVNTGRFFFLRHHNLLNSRTGLFKVYIFRKLMIRR